MTDDQRRKCGGGRWLVVGGFGGQGKGAFISREHGNYKGKFLGEQASKKILGHMEHLENAFSILGTD